MILIIILIVLAIPLLFSLLDLYYIFKKIAIGEIGSSIMSGPLAIFFVGGLSMFYLFALDIHLENDCCGDSATFSPAHRLSIYVWIILCFSGFCYAKIRKIIAPPIIEVLINLLLLIGIVLVIFIAIQIVPPLNIVGCIPILIIFMITLLERQAKIMALAKEGTYSTNNRINQLAAQILTLGFFKRFPLLMFLCLPLITLVSSILLLFGQQPDSVIKAFTQTYTHGFSQLDHLCYNVQCGGHYLCSVAANGHPAIVQPKRLGIRHGHYIICNRQLLIANAFEELLAEKHPRLHQIIRKNYNKVGHQIHRHYHVFEYKYLSDFIYLLMKPAELIFYITLYTFDTQPENRIEKQYLPKSLTS